MVINLFKSTISKDLVKVAGERREKSRPMRIRFFFSPVLEAKPRLFYLIPAQCMAFHFILQSVLKQTNKKKHSFMCPGKSFKDVGNISNCLLPTSIHSVLCASFGWGRV